MRTTLDSFSFVVNCIAGWMNQHQHDIINYQIEENRVLRQQIGDRRLRINDEQRRRLAIKAKKLSRRILAQIQSGPVQERERLGGMLNYYYRGAA